MHTGYIYQITNTRNSKVYIGKTTYPGKLRWYNHRYDAFTKKLNYPIYRAMRKHGLEYFTFNIIETYKAETLEQVNTALCEREKELIAANRPRSYNIREGGDSPVGWHHSAETLRKIEKTRRANGTWGFPESARIAAGNLRRGKRLSDEQKRKISIAHTGKKRASTERMKRAQRKRTYHIYNVETEEQCSTKDLRGWCRERGYSIEGILNIVKNGPRKSGKYHNFRVTVD